MGAEESGFFYAGKMRYVLTGRERAGVHGSVFLIDVGPQFWSPCPAEPSFIGVFVRRARIGCGAGLVPLVVYQSGLAFSACA